MAPRVRGTAGLSASPGRPGAAEAWRLSQAGDHGAAERLCRELVAADAGDAQAWCTLGVVLYDTGRHEEAIGSYRQALAIEFVNPVAHNNLANSLISTGRYDEAAESLRHALAQKPGYARAYFNLGVLEMARRQYRPAADAFGEARLRAPGDIRTLLSLGTALIYDSRADEAVACYERALALDPAQADACAGLATALAGRGDLAACRKWLERAMALRPDSLQLASTWLSALQYEPALSATEVSQAHAAWARRQAPGEAGLEFANNRDPDRSLRVGYLSPDLHFHPVAFFLAPILEHHDPARVQSVCYNDSALDDGVTRRLRECAHTWRDVGGLPDEQVARLMVDDGIDILADLAGHTTYNRVALLARRAAPVQVTYLGYPGTTGVPAVDYCLVDAVTAPAGEDALFTERLERLAHGFCCYGGVDDAPDPGPPPARECGFVTFGSMHKPLKINSRVLDLWASVLRAVPDSRLLLVRMEVTGWAAHRLVMDFARRGIAERRLDFARPYRKRNGHLEGYRDIDISLDTVPWNGHTTACDSLWMGVPMITLRGDRHAGRMTASVLTRVGLEDVIAETPEQFRDRAAALAGDTERLGELRRTLRERMRACGIGNGAMFTAALEDAYRRMWGRWLGNTDDS